MGQKSGKLARPADIVSNITLYSVCLDLRAFTLVSLLPALAHFSCCRLAALGLMDKATGPCFFSWTLVGWLGAPVVTRAQGKMELAGSPALAERLEAVYSR